MSIILNIDTAGETASASLSRNKEIIAGSTSKYQKDHASWLHPTIATMLQEVSLTMDDVNAVAVSIGPGSYTGLRVSLSAAKGLCYARNIPLITISTLKLIAFAARERHKGDYYCPLIDARRMEVYSALYDTELTEVKSPYALVIEENSFVDLISSNRVVFSGDGSKKLQNLISHPNVIFDFDIEIIRFMPYLSHDLYDNKSFADLAYTEPLYIKEFHSPSRKPFI